MIVMTSSFDQRESCWFDVSPDGFILWCCNKGLWVKGKKGEPELKKFPHLLQLPFTWSLALTFEKYQMDSCCLKNSKSSRAKRVP